MALEKKARKAPGSIRVLSLEVSLVECWVSKGACDNDFVNL